METNANVVASAAGKLFLCHKDGVEWHDPSVQGAVTLIVDRRAPVSRHIKLYNMDTMQVAFSHELYERMQWRQLSPSFYAFEISNGMAGISFASTEDAAIFSGKLRAVIPTERARKSSTMDITGRGNMPKKGFFGRSSRRIRSSSSASNERERSDGSSGPSISNPVSVRAGTRVSAGEAKNFSFSSLPEAWQLSLKNAGVRVKDVHSREQARLIYDTLAKSGMAVAPSQAKASGTPSEFTIASPRTVSTRAFSKTYDIEVEFEEPLDFEDDDEQPPPPPPPAASEWDSLPTSTLDYAPPPPPPLPQPLAPS